MSDHEYGAMDQNGYEESRQETGSGEFGPTHGTIPYRQHVRRSG